jgi:hypothetical protein
MAQKSDDRSCKTKVDGSSNLQAAKMMEKTREGLRGFFCCLLTQAGMIDPS